MMEPYETNWKNYYEILQVSPEADPKVITAAYERLVHLYHHALSDSAKESQIFSMGMTDISEAYEVLSDPVRRAAYDRMFKEKYTSQEAEAGEPTKEEIIDLMALLDQDVSKRKTRKDRKALGWSREAQRVILIVIISLLLIIGGGSSFAVAQPEHTLATPFRGVAITVAETSSAAISLIEDIRGVVATYERNIVSTALQSMRIIEGLRDVPPVTMPTNDMARFPSPEHPLFPDYLDKRNSQFKYTVDSTGTVSVNTSGATTDALLKKIEQLLKRLAERE